MQRNLIETAPERFLASLFPVIGPWTSACLSADPDVVIPAVPLEPELESIRRHRLMPLLASILPASSTVHRHLRASVHIDAIFTQERSQQIARNAAPLLSGLTAVGIPFVLIKGPGVAAHYREPPRRTFSDLDVLVRPADFTATLDRLVRSGWRENEASLQPWPSFNRWCRESVNLRRGELDQIDLHHHISPWLWATGLGLDGVLERSEELEFGDAKVRCADLSDNLLASAMQLITDHRAPGSKLLSWRDLAELGRVRPRASARRANACGLGGLLRALALAMPPESRPVELIDLLDTKIARPRRLGMALQAARRGDEFRTHVMRLPIPNGLAYTVGTAWPSRRFLLETQGRGYSRRQWWSALAAQQPVVSSRGKGARE